MDNKMVKFAVAFLFPWLKGSIQVGPQLVRTSTVNTIFHVIPAGRNEQSIPLSNISAANISTFYDVKTILIGLIIAVIGLVTMGGSFLVGLVFLLLGIGFIGSGIITRLTIQRSGSNFVVPAACYSRKNLVECKNAIDEALIHTENIHNNEQLGQQFGQHLSNLGQQLTEALNNKQ